MSSTAEIGITSRTDEAMNASSAARTSSSVQADSVTSTSSSSRARVIESRIPSDSGGVSSRPSRTQKNVHVGPSSTRPCGVMKSASSNPCSFAIRPASMLAA